MTKQEMFDKAVRGLRSQQWQVCVDDAGCSYDNGRNEHCAWGWVDEATWGKTGTVMSMRKGNIGIAPKLSPDALNFAMKMQRTHDCSASGSMLEDTFRALGNTHDLVWPE